jgi:ATP-dependent RNA helicase RhlE
MPFLSLGLSDLIVKAITDLGYSKPYPIQQQAIPVILSKKDLMGIAKTGSGKTASFVLPILEMAQSFQVSKNRHISALVLVPTRELAVQIEDVFKSFSKYLPRSVKTLAVYGGVSINPQMIQLQGVEILVATPGRLLDLLSSNALSLADVEILVIDEADKMLNLGFKEEMNKLISLLPKKRQTILFSATLDSDISTIKEQLLHKPIVVEIEPEAEHLDLITQTAYQVDNERKGPLLRYLIKENKMQQVLIFVSSAAHADAVALKLNKNGVNALALHGQKSQGARTNALIQFKNETIQALVATDLASRGIDIQFLPYVINYELPRSPKDYIHRIGRTGRAESAGEAISLVSPDEMHHFTVIQKKMKRRVSLTQTDKLNLHGF